MSTLPGRHKSLGACPDSVVPSLTGAIVFRRPGDGPNHRVLVRSSEAHHFGSGVMLQLRKMSIQPAVSFPYAFVVIRPAASEQGDKGQLKVPLCDDRKPLGDGSEF